ncbi:hypothetical protein A3K74_02935 [Candidatus Pacearchaeota archaeon RBG_13_33_26]|nr:MAG: hypothetical protein A3K74_02935 [Candidatus Pacearchaeota archaeon RBG_13_33_26]
MREGEVFIDDKKNKKYWEKDGKLSTLSCKNGFYILELHGNPYERGFAHGMLLKEQIEKIDIVGYYGGFLESLFESSDIIDKIPCFLRKTSAKVLEQWYYSPLEKRCLEETKDEMHGICDALGWGKRKRKQALRSIFAPDILEHLVAGHLKVGEETLGSYYLAGCSAAYARGRALKENSDVIKNFEDYALLARNLDFPGVFVWRNPTIIFAHPTEKLTILEKGKMRKTDEIKQPYIYISTAGFPGFGLTGLNSSGLAMATFVCLSKNCSMEGMSMLNWNNYVLTHARSMRDVREMAKNPDLKCMSPHVLMVADGKEALSFEVDSVNKDIRNSQFDIHAQTNHFFSPLLHKQELKYPLLTDFTRGRYSLIYTALDNHSGHLTLQQMINIISCNLNLKEGKTALTGDIPSQATTITSVVFRLAGEAWENYDISKNEIWVASGVPPAVCYNPYYKFGFNKDFSWDEENQSPSVSRSADPFIGNSPGFIPFNDKMRKSLEYLSLSQEEIKQGKIKFAIENIQKAREYFDDPGYLYIEALIHLRNGKEGSKKEIATALQQFSYLEKNHSFSPAKDTALNLSIGRCYDLLGKREEAILRYNNIINRNKLSVHFKIAVSKSIQTPFTIDQINNSFDYFLYGPLKFYKENSD